MTIGKYIFVRKLNNISNLSRREREKEQRREDILNSATALFFEKPYDNVSMDDIAQELELSKATLYLYFKNKHSLFFAVVIKGMNILNKILQEAKTKATTGLQQILSMTEALYSYMSSHGAYYKLNLASRSPRFQLLSQQGEIENMAEYINLTQLLFGIIEDSIKLGIEDGTIRPDIEPTKATMFLGTAIESSVLVPPEYEILLQMRGFTKREYFAHSINLLLQGISSKKS